MQEYLSNQLPFKKTAMDGSYVMLLDFKMSEFKFKKWGEFPLKEQLANFCA